LSPSSTSPGTWGDAPVFAHPSPVDLCVATVLVTCAIELVTVALRFGCGLRSDTHTRWLAKITAGRRIHHAYLGVAVMATSLIVESSSALCHALVVVGASLALSDLVHHYLVLWPLTGDPEFRTRYVAPEPVEAD
jgi:hypothetical protein